MNNKKTGLIISYGYNILNMVSGIFLSSFILNSLGDFEYGLYQAIASFINNLVILEFGTGTVMSRDLLLARKSKDTEKIKNVTSTLFWVTVVLSLLILITGAIFYLLIPTMYQATIPANRISYSQNMFVVMLAMLIFSFFSKTISGMFLGYEDYNIGSIISIFNILLRIALIVSLLTQYKYAIVVAIIDALLALATLAFDLLYTKKKYIVSFNPKYFTNEILKDSLPLCIALLMQTVINQANGSVDKVVISIKMSMESVALYSISSYVYSMFNAILTIPIAMYLPQISKDINGTSLGENLHRTLISSSRFNSLICGTLLFGFISVGQQFISIIYGEKYIEAWFYALIISIPLFISMVHGCIINVLNILNKRIISSYMLLISTAINIILTVVLIDVWGIVGAVIGTAVGTIIGQIVLLNIYYIRSLKIKVINIYIEAFKGILPAEIVASAIGYFIGSLIANKYLSFLAGGFSFVIIEFTILWLFGLNSDEKNTIYSLVAKLMRKR